VVSVILNSLLLSHHNNVHKLNYAAYGILTGEFLMFLKTPPNVTRLCSVETVNRGEWECREALIQSIVGATTKCMVAVRSLRFAVVMRMAAFVSAYFAKASDKDIHLASAGLSSSNG